MGEIWVDCVLWFVLSLGDWEELPPSPATGGDNVTTHLTRMSQMGKGGPWVLCGYGVVGLVRIRRHRQEAQIQVDCL